MTVKSGATAVPAIDAARHGGARTTKRLRREILPPVVARSWRKRSSASKARTHHVRTDVTFVVRAVPRVSARRAKHTGGSH
jgi:hypothetical protein